MGDVEEIPVAKEVQPRETKGAKEREDPVKEAPKEGAKVRELPIQETIALLGISAGANLNAGFNFLFGRNAGRNIRGGRYNIIIGDDIFGKDEDMQLIIAEKLPEIESFQLAAAVTLIPAARARIVTHCVGRHGEEKVRQAITRLNELFEYCIVRLRMLEQPALLEADRAFLTQFVR